jgi:hypothetical protein
MASSAMSNGAPISRAIHAPCDFCSAPAFSSMITKMNSTMMAPAYTNTCAAAMNCAPSSR